MPYRSASSPFAVLPAAPPMSPDKTKRPRSQNSNRKGSKRSLDRILVWLLLLGGAATVTVLSANRYMQTAKVLESPILAHIEADPVTDPFHTLDDRLLRLVVEECSKQEDSVIWVDKDKQVVVQDKPDRWHCPTIDAMVQGVHRDVATCTDIALYVMHAGGRIIPAVPHEEYNTWCGAKTARLFFETMYPWFISERPDVMHLMLVDHEHFWERDAALHKHMNVFLCKTAVCQEYLQKHVVKLGYRGKVWLMAHTSSDPSVDSRNRTSGQGLTFLHVKGTSKLKHTSEVLQCWAKQPNFPQLTVVGNFSWDEAKPYQDALNIKFLPPVARDHTGPPQRLPFSQLRQLQVDHPVHICPSERESFGHYINEARAAAAVVITVDHPPMNELVSPKAGVLVNPQKLLSYQEMALGTYGPITAKIDSSKLCEAVETVLAMLAEEIQQRGQIARHHFLYEKGVFYSRLADLKAYLKQRAAGLQAMEHRSALFDSNAELRHVLRDQLLQVEDVVPNV